MSRLWIPNKKLYAPMLGDGILSRGGGGGGFSSPADLTLSYWLDAADESSITKSGNNVTVWNDKGPLAQHLTFDGTTNPQFAADDPFSPSNSISFNGANTYTMKSPNTAAVVKANEQWFWLAFKLNATTPAGFMFELKDAFPGAATVMYVSSTVLVLGGSSGGSAHKASISWTADTSWHILEWYYDGTAPPTSASNYAAKLDDVTKTVGTLATGTFTNVTQVSTVLPINVRFGELIISDSYDEGVFSYLENKWL